MCSNFSRVLFLSCVTSVWLSGCTQSKTKDATDRTQEGIDVGIRNVGKERIDLAYVRFGDYTFRAGIISSGKEAVHVSSGQRVPDLAEVGYELENDKSVVQTVSVKEHMPTNSTEGMVLYFVVDGEQPVTVDFMHCVQVDGSWTLKHYED